MEMGQMRVEANISVSKDPNVFGTKCEVKNLNSFKSVEDAIKYEVARHIEILEEGGAIVQETRGWDEVKQETFSQRKKENAHDYRYFPDPDLPKLYLHEVFDIEEMKKDLKGMLPNDYRASYKHFELKEDVSEALLNEVILSQFFVAVTKGKDASFAQLAANYLVSDVLGLLKKEGLTISKDTLPVEGAFVTLIEMIIKNELSSRGAKDLLPIIMKEKITDVKALAEEKGLIQKNDPEALKAIVKEVLAESPTQVADYKAGKESMFMYFVGQCMKKSKGSGNPSLFQELLKEALA
jgi:aspartyl-tRNA(Asn)/glutamyl-tRNA(Gln) amidotransferase subunit B